MLVVGVSIFHQSVEKCIAVKLNLNTQYCIFWDNTCVLSSSYTYYLSFQWHHMTRLLELPYIVLHLNVTMLFKQAWCCEMPMICSIQAAWRVLHCHQRHWQYYCKCIYYGQVIARPINHCWLNPVVCKCQMPGDCGTVLEHDHWFTLPYGYLAITIVILATICL